MSLHFFSWILPDELAGMARPDGLPGDLAELRDLGVGAVVNLTRQPWSKDVFDGQEVVHMHLPVRGFDRPSLEQIDRFVAFCDQQIEQGHGVVAHCLAGRGRTGTMLACYLVHRGVEPEEAIQRVREERPGSIETRVQEGAVHEYSWHQRR
jgi:atypical dual specificity phosphatase